ncbi:nucleotide exchange factor GrpE [Cellulosilyticum lentocellum]|uniref:Protein GrpE n=1 Tax=Cellulosilyticum lentocellum (strain ATCC 49066 / DSM 5427 / NCIMB 11756 / RHM5) TaxID=642492 RepID=F2JQY4_CELLD|nr:nucleotide exchange factor GrpE [Cellulosilyticum lentocellum]ADZ83842.1 GrpE protein [Cellulosilyticum lentocellum DSM 5427]
MEENKKVDEVLEADQVSEVEESTSAEVEDPKETEAEVVEETPEETKEESDKSAEYLERLQRLMAEFDNYRKRSEKEKSDSYDFAVSNTVAELLPVIDNFERALQVESEDKNFYTGVEMIYKQLMSMLEKLHVTSIEAEGKEFDPNLHNAIMHIDDEAYGENIIVKELQKGYLYKEKVIRHSLVQVAN